MAGKEVEAVEAINSGAPGAVTVTCLALTIVSNLKIEVNEMFQRYRVSLSLTRLFGILVRVCASDEFQNMC